MKPFEADALYADMTRGEDHVNGEWDFWTDAVKLSCVGYDSRIDLDALAVLKAIIAKKYCSDIATELQLPEQYVELLQSIFCSLDWAEYGTSPRGCWLDPALDGEMLVRLFEAYVRHRWPGVEL